MSKTYELANMVQNLNAEEMQEFAELMGDYFNKNQKQLTNMNAFKISVHFDIIAKYLHNRTGN